MQTPHHLVISDVMIPVMDSVELTHQIANTLGSKHLNENVHLFVQVCNGF